MFGQFFITKKNIFKPLLLLLIIPLVGCAGFAKDIELSSLAQKKRHHEIIQMLQRNVDQKEMPSSFQLLLLSGAYYEIRDYENMLRSAALMDKQIAAGDVSYYGGNLSIYPRLFRSYAYLDQGEYVKAVKTASEAYDILNRIGTRANGFYHSQLIDITRVLGVAHTYLNHNSEVERCLAVLNSRDIAPGILGPERFIAIATIHMAGKRYQQALSAIQNPKAKVSDLATLFYDQTFQELPRFFILVKCLYETGQIQKAKEGYDQLLKHPQIKQVGGLYWPVLLDRAKIARAEGKIKEAETFLQEAVDVIEKQRSSITSEAGRIGFVGDKQAVYQELISLLIAVDRPSDAFEYVERAKGRALVDLLASQKNIATHASNTGEINSKVNELAKTEKALSIISDSGSGKNADMTRSVVISLKKDITSQAPEFISLVSVTGTPVAEIRDLLSENETLIEYYASESDWYVFVLTHDGISAKKLGPLDLDKDIRDFRASLTNPASVDYMSYSSEISKKIINPISGQIKSGRLTIVPHGPLHYLPFNALSFGEGYLVDRVNIRVLQTASILKFLKSRPTQINPSILIMGNPNLGDPKFDLKYAQDEAQSIAKIMSKATLLLRDEAKASFITENAAQFNMIHFAAHAIFDSDNPLNSALLLAKDNSSDGWLRAGDLYNLNLNADLVTLSACETALGNITKGDDVIGFTRGFLYAGAGTIISTLWKVDDQATKDLMMDFYTNLHGMEKGEALRQAQLNTKKTYAHPFYWAAFQLTGNAK